MAKFREKLDAKVSLKTFDTAAHQVYVFITDKALAKMQIYVEQCSDEIGWLGTARRDKNTFIIDDVYLFEQEVHATTTEITPEGLSAFGEAILSQPDGVEIWNNLRMWGHSHVNMGVTPSGQDDKQMEEFRAGGHPWFIRLIANKRGEMKIDVFDYTYGIAFIDVPFERILSPAEEEIETRISQLHAELDALQDVTRKALEDDVKAEMASLVRKKTYTYTYNYNKGGTVNNKVVHADAQDDVKKNATNMGGGVGSVQASGVVVNGLTSGFIKDRQDVVRYFGYADLAEISECETVNDVKDWIEVNYDGDKAYTFFTVGDLLRIRQVAREYVFKTYQDEYIK